MAYVTTTGFGTGVGIVDGSNNAPLPAATRPSSDATPSGLHPDPPFRRSPGGEGVASRAPLGSAIIVALDPSFTPRSLCASRSHRTAAGPRTTTATGPRTTAEAYPDERVVIAFRATLGTAFGTAASGTASSPAGTASASIHALPGSGTVVTAMPYGRQCPAGTTRAVVVGLTQTRLEGLTTDGTGYVATMSIATDGLTARCSLVPNAIPVRLPDDVGEVVPWIAADGSVSTSEPATSEPATSEPSTTADPVGGSITDRSATPPTGPTG